jgi:hypothetical protein
MAVLTDEEMVEFETNKRDLYSEIRETKKKIINIQNTMLAIKCQLEHFPVLLVKRNRTAIGDAQIDKFRAQLDDLRELLRDVYYGVGKSE